MRPPEVWTDGVVRARGVGRDFGRRAALGAVDFDIRAGSIFGLVGANGAGKTTLLRILAGFLRTSRGSVQVLGRDPRRERAEVQREARFVFAPPALYEGLSAREHVRGLAALHGTTPTPVEVDGALAKVGLLVRARDRVRTFSFGMRQRLALACALVPLPRLLVLDEPTDGLDPVAVRELRHLMQELRAETGLSILFSSHLLAEVDRLADSLLVLHEGQTLYSGTPAAILRQARCTRVEVDDPEAALAQFEARGLAARRVEGEVGMLRLESTDHPLEEVQRWLQERGIRLTGFALERPSLEEALFPPQGSTAAREPDAGTGP